VNLKNFRLDKRPGESHLALDGNKKLKTFFQLLQIKRLQLKLTNTLQKSYQIQVPRAWVKQHPKNKRKSISKLFHAQTGSIWFQIGSYWFL